MDTNVPSEFLKDVYFVEQVPLMALQVDPRISYALYIPKSHYTPNPNGSGSTGGKLPLLVYVHGTGRNISAIYSDLVPFTNSTPCAVLAPVFPAGMDGPNDLDSYKQLRSSMLCSDLGLLAVLDRVACRWPGLATEKAFMMGFSGGGQPHRFLYLYPERLAAISVGAPGRPTLLDEEQDWPLGVADAQAVFGKTVRTDLIAEVPIQLVIGSEDTRDVLGAGGLPPMKETRVESIQQLRGSLAQAGIETQFDIVDGVAHDETGARNTVLGFLQPLIRKGF
ncbi:alpha/beta-hydrolase [Jackrogersella minutella]|nr:alpha/beta-hydrolase [Jackrogersella minutella]